MKLFIAAIMAIVLASAVAANSGNDFNESMSLIASKVPCSQLNDSQLEMMGEYYMEQMHPGELHEIMDERMGGEGSESLRLIHIGMARSFYCGDSSAMTSSMMSMMMGRSGSGMMGSGFGMMGQGFGMMGYGSSYYGSGSVLSGILLVLLIVIAVLLILWLIKQLGQKPGRKH